MCRKCLARGDNALRPERHIACVLVFHEGWAGTTAADLRTHLLELLRSNVIDKSDGVWVTRCILKEWLDEDPSLGGP